RAKSCYEYILSKGIGKDRMTYMGKGEVEPIASNETDEGRELNR
ncbi:MAG: OmpA family protein, partial [Bacteroidota bacterium]